jgi:hypothetical protein
MGHAEAAEAAVNKFVTRPEKRSAALVKYYKTKYLDSIIERAKDLSDKQAVPNTAATIQAIDEIIDNVSVRDQLKERVYMMGLARQGGLPSELAQSILGGSF